MPERPRGEQPEARLDREGPRGLDVIRLDGRWAQVVAASEQLISVRYLDDGSTDSELDLSSYELARDLDTHVGWLAQRIGEGLTDDERANLHFGPEIKDNPHFVDDIHVFGEFRKRDQSSTESPSA